MGTTADIVETVAQARTADTPPLLIRESLVALLDREGLGAGPLEAERIGEGHSNITYRLHRGPDSYVLRRPPRPPLPPSAHDMLREARLLSALEPVPARTPRVLCVCADEDVIGAPFYVMEEVAGAVLTATVPAGLDTPQQSARIGEQLVDALAELHAVDWRAAGLEWLGRAEGYLERQLRRFGGLWEHNRTRELPLVVELGRWLAEHLPSSGSATIVHGDYRLGNVMFSVQRSPRLVAIFDWELSTIGDPLADLGYLTATWVEPDDPADTIYSSLAAATRVPGFPSRDELVARYRDATGRPTANLPWYQALALWKAAIFMEGNYKRYLAGRSDDEYLATLNDGVPALARRAAELARI